MKKNLLAIAIVVIAGVGYSIYSQKIVFQDSNNWGVEIQSHSAAYSFPEAGVQSSSANSSVCCLTSEARVTDRPVGNVVPVASSDGVAGFPVEHHNWRMSRGLFEDADLKGYEGLKLDDLEELTRKGDLKAIAVLANYERASGNSKRYRELVDWAAVHGSLHSLGIYKLRKLGDYVLHHKEADILEAFAYIDLEAKRGNLQSKYTEYKSYSNFYKFTPTEEQIKYIDRRSDELMADLEKRRKELGLPPFDNEPSEFDKKLYKDWESPY